MRITTATTGTKGRIAIAAILSSVFLTGKRAHRDWRVWVGLFFMLAAITIYVLSEDLAFLPHG